MKNKIYFFNLLHNLRINISLLLLNFLLKFKKNSSILKKLKLIFLSFKEKGYCKVEKFYTNNEIQYLQNLLLKDTSNYKEIENKNIDLEVKEGMMKIKHIENIKPEIKRFLNSLEFILISTFFYFKFKRCISILSLSQSGDNQIQGLKGKCIEPIANIPHVDSFKPFLKGIIFLEDVNIENGPTAIYPKSVTSKFIKEYTSLHKNKDTQWSKENIYAFLSQNQKEIIKNDSKVLTGKKGDLALFDSRDIHWATDLKLGSRKVLHLYF